jgi:hypothetical protein
MSNMLYACSIFYKSKLPMVIVFNKADIVDPAFLTTWMQDFEVFQEAVSKEKAYSADLARSMNLALEQFYLNFKVRFVSFRFSLSLCSCASDCRSFSSDRRRHG